MIPGMVWMAAAGVVWASEGGGSAVATRVPVEARAWLDGAVTPSGGRLAVQVEADAGVAVELAPPVAEGLTFTMGGPPRVEQIAGREVRTVTWAFAGPAGHYEVKPGGGTYSGAMSGEIAVSPIFVDMGVDPVRPQEISDIAEPSRVWTIPWGTLAIVGGVGALAVGGTALAFRRKPAATSDVPVDPPDVVALRAWDAVRRDSALDPHAKALELSRIFREYAEEVLRFPATAWTTTESLDYLASLPHLAQGNVPRAKRMLRATDRVKYAEAATTHELLDEWDADLRAFVAATRPRGWEEVKR